MGVAGVTSVLTVVIFSKTFRRNRKSEQIKIARETQDKINIALDERNEFAHKNPNPTGSNDDKEGYFTRYLTVLDNISVHLGYFTFLVNVKEIDDDNVLRYYREGSILRTFDDQLSEYAEVERLARDYGFTLTTRQASWVAERRRRLLENRRVWVA